jgi:hypothetical protein
VSPGFPAENSRDRPYGVETNSGMAAAHLAAIAQAMNYARNAEAQLDSVHVQRLLLLIGPKPAGAM